MTVPVCMVVHGSPVWLGHQLIVSVPLCIVHVEQLHEVGGAILQERNGPLGAGRL